MEEGNNEHKQKQTLQRKSSCRLKDFDLMYFRLTNFRFTESITDFLFKQSISNKI